jgi:hypothetical protein
MDATSLYAIVLTSNFLQDFRDCWGGWVDGFRSCMLIPKYSLLPGEPRDCSIDVQTGKVVQTRIMFLPRLAGAREMFRN